MPNYIDVILPLPLHQRFTYSLPEGEEAAPAPGCRVVIPFGKKKYYTGIVCKVHQTPPKGYEVKEVFAVLDNQPVLLPEQFRLWEWLADYYLCAQGDVYKAALPSGMKLESETVVVYNPEFEATAPLTEKESKVLDVLAQEKELSVTRLEKSGVKNPLAVVKSLLEQEALFLKEEIKRIYKPKTEVRISLAEAYRTEDQLRDLFDELGRAPKQLALLMKYVELSGILTEKTPKEISKKELLQRSSASPVVLAALTDKHIFELYHHEVGRLRAFVEGEKEINPLNEFQQRAHDEIIKSFQEKNVCLLHGVTSSGKTEIYIHLITEAIARGEQVLYLLPEIALTTQITERLKKVFGERIGIYHSKFPDAERVEVWQKQLTAQPYDVILGVRSSVFLPFRKLGLVIVDEEHEATYKQQDPAPRYHARNVAIVLASYYGAKTLLGTATPSIETYYNAKTGKYGLVELNARYQEMQLPEIIPVDIKELRRKKIMKGNYSPLLLEEIRKALDSKEQVILFQNRRGFAPMIECRTCGWVPKCDFCDVSLTYHQAIRQMVCHYCGAVYPLPRMCPACEGTQLMDIGLGTEKVEEEIKERFPEARIARMDLDTTRSRTAYENIISDFEAGKTDILIGTQMISKGLDFDHVSVVGILDADTMLNFPDFRAYERAFQMMAQVAGRAGRKYKRGKVILQTRDTENQIIPQVIANDYLGMASKELRERKKFHYPPFYRLIYMYIKHKEAAQLNTMAQAMAERLRAVFGNRILGPDKPPVGRVQNLYIKKIIIKIENEASIASARERLKQVQREVLSDERFKSFIVYYDVDPM